MAKRITVKQLQQAIAAAPGKVKEEGQLFLQRGLAEYKAVAGRTPWRVGQSGGGIPVLTGNLMDLHQTNISGLEGRYGVNPNSVKYARRVYYGFKGKDKLGRNYNQEGRPWLDYARQKANSSVERHYKVFMDNILNFIAT